MFLVLMQFLISQNQEAKTMLSMVMEVSASWKHSGRGLIRGTAPWSSISYKGKGWNMAHLPKPLWQEVFGSFWWVYQNLHIPLDGAEMRCLYHGVDVSFLKLEANDGGFLPSLSQHRFDSWICLWICRQSGIDGTLHINTYHIKILFSRRSRTKISCSINKK